MAWYYANKTIMEIRRFFVDNQDINGDIATIKGSEFLHLTKVLRHKVGYKIVVANNNDNIDYYAEITKIDKDYCLAKITEKAQNLTSTTAVFDLYQALPKGDKIDLIVQKSVELGVNCIYPFISDNVAETKINHERLNRIALEACKQCGRAKIVEVMPLINFKELISCLCNNNYDLVVLPSEHENKLNLSSIDGSRAQKIAIIVGSEGGFKLSETQELVEKANAKAVTLGHRILRAETASIATLAIMTYKLGEMDK